MGPCTATSRTTSSPSTTSTRAASGSSNLAIGRDCTAPIESYHLRPEVSTARFNKLPVLEDFPVTAVPRAPRPNDSPLLQLHPR